MSPEKRLLLYFLDRVDDAMSAASCNDLDLEDIPGVSPDEAQAMCRRILEADQDREDPLGDRGGTVLMDFQALDYVRTLLETGSLP